MRRERGLAGDEGGRASRAAADGDRGNTLHKTQRGYVTSFNIDREDVFCFRCEVKLGTRKLPQHTDSEINSNWHNECHKCGALPNDGQFMAKT